MEGYFFAVDMDMNERMWNQDGNKKHQELYRPQIVGRGCTHNTFWPSRKETCQTAYIHPHPSQKSESLKARAQACAENKGILQIPWVYVW